MDADRLNAIFGTIRKSSGIILIINIVMILMIVALVISRRKQTKEDKKITNRYNPDGSIRERRGTTTTITSIFVFILIVIDTMWFVACSGV